MTTNPIVFPKNKFYLRNFLEVVLGKDGKMNILVANKFYELLHLLISRPPKDYVPEATFEYSMCIELPKWKNKDPQYYFYLSKINQEIILDWLYKTFFITFNRYLNRFSTIIQYKMAIEKFMEDYNVDPGHYDMLKKYDLRYRNKILSKKHQKILTLFMANRPL